MAATKTSFTARLLRRLLVLGVFVGLGLVGWNWLQKHPQHNPMAPLDLRDPIGYATATKLVALRDDVEQCRAVLDRSDLAYTALPPTGDGACERADQTRLSDFPLSPNVPATTCPVAAALELWRSRSVEPAARKIYGSDVARFEHMGVYNCRRIRGSSNNWSQHATGNAIDISAIVLEDGTRVSLISDWNGDANDARFLRQIRDGACEVFAVVLSPDYNVSHADHFHFDQGGNMLGVCR